MADALIKVGTNGPDPAWQDGDIIGIYPTTICLFKNAEMQCGVGRFGAPRARTLKATGTLEHLWFERTHRWRHERVSRFEVLKIDRTGAVAPELRIVPMLPENIARYLRNESHNIFGTPGHEIWYRSPIDFSPERMAHLWDGIEPILGQSRTNFMRMPFGKGDMRVHLCVTFEDITHDEATPYIKPEMDGDGKIVRRRSHSVEWRGARFGLSQGDINKALNRSIETDERSLMMVNRIDVVTKITQ